MEEIGQFLLTQWVLSGLFLVLLVLLIVTELKGRSFGLPGVAPNELVNMINHSRAVVIDVRDKPLYEQGHILGSINLRESELEGKKNSLNKYKSRPLVVVCETGTSSPKVANWLLTQGFKEIYYLKGGVQSWRSENLPVSKH